MSKESNDVALAENVPAQTETVTTPEPTSFAELMQTWTPEQRKTWNDTGVEPKQADPVISDDKKTPVPDKAKTVPDTGPANEDQDTEPEYFGTAEQIARQKHAFSKLKRRFIEADTERRLLRERNADKPTATAPSQATQKPNAQSKASERPKRPALPDITDYTTEQAAEYKAAVKKFNDVDMPKYEDDVRAFDRHESARERDEHAAAETRREKVSVWAGELTAGKTAHQDFESVVFNDAFTVSLPMGEVLMGMKGGGSVLYYLGQHPEEAAELVKDTDIAGAFQTYKELAEAAESDPRLARQLGAAEALVKAAARRILAQSNGATNGNGSNGSNGNGKVPDSKPVIVTKVGPPAARVDSSGSPAKDPIVQAEADYERTGDHKYLELMNKLMDERDRAARRR